PIVGDVTPDPRQGEDRRCVVVLQRVRNDSVSGHAPKRRAIGRGDEWLAAPMQDEPDGPDDGSGVDSKSGQAVYADPWERVEQGRVYTRGGNLVGAVRLHCKPPKRPWLEWALQPRGDGGRAEGEEG